MSAPLRKSQSPDRQMNSEDSKVENIETIDDVVNMDVEEIVVKIEELEPAQVKDNANEGAMDVIEIKKTDNNATSNDVIVNEDLVITNSEVAQDVHETALEQNSNKEPEETNLANISDPATVTDEVSAGSTEANPTPGCSNNIPDEHEMPKTYEKPNVQLYTDDTGPQMYNAKGSLVTATIITKNLPHVFEYLPIHGRPQENQNLKDFYSKKIRDFVGCDLSDYEFMQLKDFCSPDRLKTGKEVVMGTSVPVMGVVGYNIIKNLKETHEQFKEAPNLCILKKNKMRNDKDSKGLFNKKLKYRGVRNLPFTQEVYHMAPIKPTAEVPDIDLEPGKDILYRVRVYRPYTYNLAKDRFTRTRHSVFCCDIILTGRHKLSDLRDRFVCHNDFDMRVDVSNHPDMLPNTKAKEVFPSGFLFINNVFYVDTREGCIDYSEPIRAWALKKNLGVFPKRDMCQVKLEDLVLKCGYPEVYVHQGNCEHVFLFSEIRLLSPRDPLQFHNYPCSTAIAQNQTVYCTTCAEFSAKWIVVGCSRVPFDPAFFCETCFRQYLYKDGQKIGEFKAYSYRGNALNVLKPQ